MSEYVHYVQSWVRISASKLLALKTVLCKETETSETSVNIQTRFIQEDYDSGDTRHNLLMNLGSIWYEGLILFTNMAESPECCLNIDLGR